MMALLAAKAAMGDERHLSNVLENIRKGREYLYGALKSLGLEAFPSEANFVLVKVGPTAEGLTRKLFEERILVRWLGGYGLGEYLRITVGTMDENRRFIEALTRLRV